jgi:hypothetical protein
MTSEPQPAAFMTEDQAEEIVMADEVGMFHGRPSELAHARLLLANRDAALAAIETPAAATNQERKEV